VELECLEVTEARKTLGVNISPTGDNTAQFEHMLEAPQKWAAQVQASNLRQIDAWLALCSTIWKTLEYSLICTKLTQKECEQIMQSAMSAGLAKSHIYRSFPNLLIHRGAEALGVVASPLYSPRYCKSEHSSISQTWRMLGVELGTARRRDLGS
jgi:hypothetical protein